jgi:hypothetical protein
VSKPALHAHGTIDRVDGKKLITLLEPQHRGQEAESISFTGLSEKNLAWARKNESRPFCLRGNIEHVGDGTCELSADSPLIIYGKVVSGKDLLTFETGVIATMSGALIASENESHTYLLRLPGSPAIKPVPVRFRDSEDLRPLRPGDTATVQGMLVNTINGPRIEKAHRVSKTGTPAYHAKELNN